MALDTEIEKLFKTCTVDEVKQELNKIRNNIEKKKEDLRVMVGERYRDLIEAADTIQQMEGSCAGVCEKVATVQKLCSSLQHRGLIGFRTSPQHVQKSLSSSREQHSTEAQVKVVVLASTRVWSLLERRELLAATQLYLLTQHTHTALMLSHGPNKKSVASCYPVLARHWASVCQLPATITRLCQHTITTTTTTAEHTQHKVVCEAVVSLLLLQSDSVSAALHKVLQLLQHTLLHSLSNYTPQQTARPLVTAFASRLMDALTLLHAVFATDSSRVDGLSAVEACVLQVAASAPDTSADSNNTVAAAPHPVALLQETDAFLSLLPHALLQYRPRMSNSSSGGGDAGRLKDGELSSTVSAWLDAVVEAAKLHLHNLLRYCPSLQSVCVVRDSVWSVLDTRQHHNWHQVTTELGLGTWCVWHRVVRECVQARAQQLIKEQLSRAVTHTLDNITQLTHSITHDNRVSYEEGSGVVQFVWSEAAGDLPDKVGWLSAAQRTLQQAGGLAYKSYGYTGRTQAICGALDGQLAALRQDLEHMRCTDTDGREGAKQDYEDLLRLLQEQSDFVFASLLGGIEQLAEECSAEARKQSSTSTCGGHALDDDADEDTDAFDDIWDTTGTSDGGGSGGWPSQEEKMLLRQHQTVLVSLARLCHALTNICPNLQLCALATALLNPDTVRRVCLGLPVECSEGVWQQMEGRLQGATASFLQEFLVTLTTALSAAIMRGLLRSLQQDTTTAMLGSMAMCDSVEVCEEAAEGEEKVVSKLAVPSQPSPALYRALHTLCRCLNAATLHTLSRSFSSTVAGQVCRSVVLAYSKIVSVAVSVSNQQLALHLLFDLKFVAATMLPTDHSDKRLADELSSLQQQLESCVDPFDLSVFQTHLNARVRAAANRSQVILGAVFVRERQHPSCKVSSTTSNAGAVLPLVPVVDIPRFSNVPLPKSSSLASSRLTALVDGFSLGQDRVSGAGTLPHQVPQRATDEGLSIGVGSSSAATAAGGVSSSRSTSGAVSGSTLAASLPAGARSASAIFSAMSSSWFGGGSTSK
uniref:Conserved oligomeric Golgi complex subunit 1 n=2 Tax=Hirondellea gigas TaxID=1518452 RepID=A0A6A7FXM8_9CRUS